VGQVVEVADGDTVTVLDANKEWRLEGRPFPLLAKSGNPE